MTTIERSPSMAGDAHMIAVRTKLLDKAGKPRADRRKQPRRNRARDAQPRWSEGQPEVIDRADLPSFWRGLPGQSAVSPAMMNSKPRSAALIDEAPLHAPSGQGSADLADYIHARNPNAAQHVRPAILQSLQNLGALSVRGPTRRLTVEGVRKLVIRKYPYLAYYTVDEPGEEIVILTIQHPSRNMNMRTPDTKCSPGGLELTGSAQGSAPDERDSAHVETTGFGVIRRYVWQDGGLRLPPSLSSYGGRRASNPPTARSARVAHASCLTNPLDRKSRGFRNSGLQPLRDARSPARAWPWRGRP